MERVALTFPVFYHCAIKGACPLQQYNCVNMLLCGKMKTDDGTSISETTASVYVNGVKPLPKDLIFDLLHLSADEVIRRLKELNFFDVSAIAAALARLLEVVPISLSTKEELLKLSNTPNLEYLFICEVFWAAIKNPASNTTRISREEKDIIKACRDNAPLFPIPPVSESVIDTAAEEPESPLDGQHGKTDFLHHAEPDSIQTIGNFEEILHVCKWVAKSSAQREGILDFCNSTVVNAPGLINLDIEDVAAVLPKNDASYAVLLKCEGNIDEVIQYIEHSYSHNFSSTISFLLSIEVSTEIDMGEAFTITDTICSKCSPDVNSFIGLRLDEDISPEDIRLYIIASIPVNDSVPESKAEVPHPANEVVEVGEVDENDQFPLNLFKK